MNLTTLEAEAAKLLKVSPRSIRIEQHSRGPLVRIGVQAPDTPQAEAAGIEYTFSPNHPIAEGADPLAALLDLARKIERARCERGAA